MKGKLTDWQGNEIKAGQTVLKVRTKPLFKNPQIMIPQGLGEFKMIDLPEPPEHIWSPGLEYLIHEFKGRLFAKLPKNSDGKIWNLAIETFNFMQADEIICIKGVSDSEQDYYNDYFKLS